MVSMTFSGRRRGVVAAAAATVALAAAVLMFPASAAVAAPRPVARVGPFNPLAPALGFNAFIEHNATLVTNETEGPIAIGGDLTIGGNYQVALHTAGTYVAPGDTFPSALVVGGKVNFAASVANSIVQVSANQALMKIGDVSNADILWKDQNNADMNTRAVPKKLPLEPDGTPRIQLNYRQDPLNVHKSPIDFAAAFATMRSTSTQLGTCANNVTLTSGGLPVNSPIPAGTTVDVGIAPGVTNVLNITGADLNNIVGLNFPTTQPSATAPLIINVDVSGVFAWTPANAPGAVAPYVLYNFPAATGITQTTGSAAEGTVLAPNAVFNDQNASNNEGQVVSAAYVHSGGELHKAFFASTNVSCASAAPADLTVLKEACWSATPTDCQLGGGGTWANIASVPQGGTAYWRITVTNNGAQNINGITLDDPVEAGCETAAGAPFTLTPAASKVIYCDTGPLAANTTNTVTATGTPDVGAPITTPPSSARAKTAGATVLKEVCRSLTVANCTAAGGTGPWGPTATVPLNGKAYWRITVTNTGGLAFAGMTLTDAAEPGCVTAAGSFNLPVGGSHIVYCSTSSVAAPKTNTVSASGTPEIGPVYTTPTSSATATPLPLTVVKDACWSATSTDCTSATGPWGPTASVPYNGTAYWRVTVTNTGAATLTGVTLSDNRSTCDTAAGTFSILAGATLEFYCSTSPITTATTNTVTATVTPPDGPSLTTPPSTATANTVGVAVLKEACRSQTAADCRSATGPWAPTASIPVGGTAYWRITVTNIGTVDMTGVTIADPNEPTCVPAVPFNVPAAGPPVVFYCSTTSVTTTTANAVTATFTPPAGTPQTTPPSTATVETYGVTVLKEVCQSADAADCGATGTGPWGPTTALPAGATAYWRITATNTGSLDLTGVTLTDDYEPSCVPAAPFDLPAAGPPKVIHCSTASIMPGDRNSASVTFTPPGGPPVAVTTPPSTAPLHVPDIAVVKDVCTSLIAADCGPDGDGPWADTASLPTGSTAHWRIVVVNVGTEPLADITMSDLVEPSCAAGIAPFSLAPGDFLAFYCATSSVTAAMVNTVVVVCPQPIGMPPGLPDLTDSDDATVTVFTPPNIPTTGAAVQPVASAGAGMLLLGVVLVGTAALSGRRRREI